MLEVPPIRRGTPRPLFEVLHGTRPGWRVRRYLGATVSEFPDWASAVAFAKACAARERGTVTVRWEDAGVRAAAPSA